MKTHDLKCWPEFYKQVSVGLKPFEIRRNDRDFQRLDRLRLREYCPAAEAYSGAEVTMVVTYVLPMHDGLIPGYVIMGLRRLPSELESHKNFLRLMNSDVLEAEAKALSDPELANRIANEVQGSLSYIEMPWYLVEEALHRLDPTLKNETNPGS